jgi:hypothetical protein
MKVRILFVCVTLLFFNSNAHCNLLDKAYKASYKHCKNSQKKYFKCFVGRKKERDLTTSYFKEAEKIYGKHDHDTWASINKYVHDNLVAYHKNEFEKEKFFLPHNRKADIKLNSQRDLANTTNSKKDHSNAYSGKTFQDMNSTESKYKRRNIKNVQVGFGNSAPNL